MLDFEEVKSYLLDRCPHIPKEGLRAQFDAMDQNKDGSICKNEMFDYVKGLMTQYHLKRDGT